MALHQSLVVVRSAGSEPVFLAALPLGFSHQYVVAAFSIPSGDGSVSKSTQDSKNCQKCQNTADSDADVGLAKHGSISHCDNNIHASLSLSMPTNVGRALPESSESALSGDTRLATVAVERKSLIYDAEADADPDDADMLEIVLDMLDDDASLFDEDMLEVEPDGMVLNEMSCSTRRLTESLTRFGFRCCCSR